MIGTLNLFQWAMCTIYSKDAVTLKHINYLLYRRTCRQKSENVQSVVDGDNYDVPKGHQWLHVVMRG